MSTAIEDDRALTTAQVAKLLNTSPSTIKALIRRGLPSFQVGKKCRRVWRSQLLNWLEKNSSGQPAESGTL